MNIEEGKLLYHLTTLDVFESIVVNGLLSRGELEQRGIYFVDTANHSILNERERLNLVNYVPFHFHPHTNYDTYVKNNNREKAFLYLCLHRSYAHNHGFSVLPIHPTSTDQPNIYSFDDGMASIDWSIMNLKKTDTLPINVTERQRILVRMAECLSPVSIPISDFHSIIVRDDECANFVRGILCRYNIDTNPPYIDVNSIYF